MSYELTVIIPVNRMVKFIQTNLECWLDKILSESLCLEGIFQVFARYRDRHEKSYEFVQDG